MCICRFTIAIIIFLHLGFTVFGYPLDDIALNCGSSGNSTALDGREWIGDVGSKSSTSSSSPHHPKGKSTISRALNQYPSADHVPYVTARISRSQFTYTFDVRPGQKFIRLHFYPFSYIGFDVSMSLFSVNAGPYTLLSNFSAFLIADSLGVKYFAKEYLVNVDDNQALSITFSPSASTSSEKVYAFINGIEIVSMPTGVYYSLKGDLGVPVVGEDYRFYIANRTALETVYRLNVGGRSILPVEDLGMYRLWSEDRNYLSESGSVSVRTNTLIDNRNVRTYVAPPRIYQTSWSMGGPNLTWKLPLNLGFRYLVRLHFYELESENSESAQSDFVIFFNSQIAEIDEGVIDPSRQDVFSVYMDYLVMMDGDRMEGKRDLIIALFRKPKHESGTRQNSALLNGLEIFKLSNPDNNLAGPNPMSMTRSLTSWTSKLRRLVFNFGSQNLIATSVTLTITLVSVIVYLLNHWGTNSGEMNKSSPWEEKSCRHFSLAEMQLATNNFNDALVIGIGGFGKVYEGRIDRGAKTVAIKRLKLESKQGALEFWTEIETLSTYRHIHLVSLIGYCDEGQEMLLVYEYMKHGTLADRPYKIRDRNGSGSGSSPLSWERRLRICIGAALGLDYLHTGRGPGHGLIHRDVKSSNILLDENWVAKISDFGLSKMNAANLSCTHISTDVKGTFGYLDPEYFMTRRLTSKSDVYAFGVVLFEVLCGRPAVDRSLVEEQHSLALWVKRCIKDRTIDQIVDTSVREQISSHCLKAFVEIAAKCLLEYDERPTMAEVVRVLEFELVRQSSAYSDTEEEISNVRISLTSPTMEENINNVDHNIAYGVNLSPKSTKTPRMKKDNASNRGSIWGWRWDSLWRRAKPSRVVTFPQPEVISASSSLPSTQSLTASQPPVSSPAPPQSAPELTPVAPAPTPAPAPVSWSSSESNVYGRAATNRVAGGNLEATIQQILDMGGGSWDRDTVLRALRTASNNPERAVEYLYVGIPQQVGVPPASQAPASGPAVYLPAQVPQPAFPSRWPNANPLDHFPQGYPTVGSNANAGTLNFLRNSQQFQALKAMVQANPSILQPMLQELGKQNQQLMRLIQENQADFLLLINEPVEGGEGFNNILGQRAEEMPQAVTVTHQEREAIERLEALGFDRALVLEVFFACNKNEEGAARYLLDHMHEFEDLCGLKYKVFLLLSNSLSFKVFKLFLPYG